jgi:polysulfide reductase chain C
MENLTWGILLAAYLFVGGMAGGAFIIGALADIFGKGKYKVLSKSGVYVSLISIIIGLVLLILDLGRFEVDPLSPLNAYITSRHLLCR